jgi:hypothetical protein
LKKALKITGISLGALLILLTIAFFAFRNTLLQWAIDKISHKLKDKYQCALYIEKASLSGIASIDIQKLYIIPEQEDTLLSLARVRASVQLSSLIFGDVKLTSLELESAMINLVQYDSARNNYSAFLKGNHNDHESSDQPKDKNIAETVYKLINRLLDLVPQHLKIDDTGVRLNHLGDIYAFKLAKVAMDEDALNAHIDLVTPSKKQQFVATGQFNPGDMTGDIHLHALDRSKMTIPYVDEKYNFLLGADEVQLKLNEVEMDGGELSLKCFASYTNLLINHARLADHDVTVPSGSGNFHFQLGEDYIRLDSSSQITLNKISCYPYFRYQRNPCKAYELKLRTDRMLAQDFFTSLPTGMFESLNGIRAEGFLTYHMQCMLNDTAPWKTVFESEMKPEQFRITNYGTAYLPKINGQFTYTPYEYGRPQRPIEVGYDNPNFVPIDDISSYIKNAVLTSEDPSFYSHRGFVMDAIRQSIAQNYVSKKFARGGSTISMQLVKNIFLSRKKTLTRKFEEMLLVWMIENLGISNKQRMFEVYLNIIEWGPNIYGIGEATRFYYNKSPQQVTLPEALYLASIIPRPKGFAWSFNDSTASLKPYLANYFKHMTKLMVARELISPEDTNGLASDVQLRGAAKGFLKKYKNVPADSLMEVEEPPISEFNEDLELK